MEFAAVLCSFKPFLVAVITTQLKPQGRLKHKGQCEHVDTKGWVHERESLDLG